MANAKELSEAYIKWVKESYKYQQISNETVRIDLPFLDNFSDEIVMYVISEDADNLRITDDGWTLDNLQSLGLNILHSPSRKKLLNTQLNAYGVQLQDDELYIQTHIDKFAADKHRFLQAILFINDMFMLNHKKTTDIFLEDVNNFFTKNNIRTFKNISYIGKSGLPHKYDFAISGIANKIPEKLIKTMSSKNNSLYAKAILADIEQTRYVTESDTNYYVFLNDQDGHKQVKTEIIKLFKDNQIEPVLYSQKKQYIKEFSA
ncbi:DUF1828 domain-containing protein [Bombilactobacillus folatiphilus]|uniref:DUF1828 domain-containing protein n=1 Tax=Bombilactobacillus folatiphilus TaxID=2923362 RepID=A0ABY4P855_9LACO|nr:DUF1828 domain-containing protein [Bombilactobacillus folatiphilus]UQS81898.1 DUF1828 domain-containing protein [Bombilactobacillus folatiphilus]